MTQRHPVWQLLDKLQMDLRAMNAKLTELRAEVASLPVDLADKRAPFNPEAHIRRLIQNGVIADTIDLLAEFQGQGLTDQRLWFELVDELPRKAVA